MRNRLPSPALVVAALALAVALGGSSYAAIKLPRGSVGTRQIKDRAVTPKKLSKLEAWHVVGAPGQPAFSANWSSSAPAVKVSFRKDRDGLVHLRGTATRGMDVAGASIFVLPPGYRPAQFAAFPVASTNAAGTMAPSGGVVEVQPTGNIFVYVDTDDNYVSLSGITFYAGG